MRLFKRGLGSKLPKTRLAVCFILDSNNISSAHSSSRDDAEATHPSTQDLNGFHERLSRIELALEKLALAVEKLSPTTSHVDATLSAESSSHIESSKYEPYQDEKANSQLFANQNQLPIPPANVSIDMEALGYNTSLLSHHQPTLSRMQYHPGALAVASGGMDSGIALQDSEPLAGFFIPSRAVGHALISRKFPFFSLIAEKRQTNNLSKASYMLLIWPISLLSGLQTKF